MPFLKCYNALMKSEDPPTTEYQKFDDLLGKLLAVPHSVIKQRMEEYKKQRKRRKRAKASRASRASGA